jgi:hypothetical protein
MEKIFNIHIADPSTLWNMGSRRTHTECDIVEKTFHDLMDTGHVWIVGPHDKYPNLNAWSWEREVDNWVENANEFYMYSGAEFDLTPEDDRRHRVEMARWQRLEFYSKRVVSPTSGKQGWKVWTVDPQERLCHYYRGNR